MSSNTFRMIRKFILNFSNYCIQTVVVPKLLVFNILFSTSLIYVFRTVVATKPLVSGIFYQQFQFFF